MNTETTRLWNAAQVAIRTLTGLGYIHTCFIGGVACALHGNTRTPKDLDILILGTTDDAGRIKSRIASADGSFYLLPSRKIGATYKILYYDASMRSQRPYYRTNPTLTSVKVDILVPGVMEIPSFPTQHIVQLQHSRITGTLPSVPLSLLIIMKLRAWSEHHNATEYYFSKEQYKDKADLQGLVTIAVRQNLKPKDEAFITPSLITKAQERLSEFFRVYPHDSSKAGWIAMGFVVPTTETRSIFSSTIAPNSRYTSTRWKRDYWDEDDDIDFWDDFENRLDSDDDRYYHSDDF